MCLPHDPRFKTPLDTEHLVLRATPSPSRWVLCPIRTLFGLIGRGVGVEPRRVGRYLYTVLGVRFSASLSDKSS